MYKFEPALIIHGGIANDAIENEEEQSLRKIAKETYKVLLGTDSYSAVVFALGQLEDDPLFNAGKGSTLQSDFKARMSAAIMSGLTNRFAGVINVQNVKPVKVLEFLMNEPDYTVLASTEAEKYALQKGLRLTYNAITNNMLNTSQKIQKNKSGTVGIVAIDKKSNISVGTSTGGIGSETPGRVSDSATVAGTYASNTVGVSCTGIGEHIISQAVAAKIVTRVQDGMNLQNAVRKTIIEAEHQKYMFGLVSLDKNCNMVVGKTKDCLVRYVKIKNKNKINSWLSN